MKILKLTRDNNITVHEYPNGNYREQNTALSELIGNGCRLVEEVRPKRLYEKLKFKFTATENEGDSVSMLVDEEGLLKDKIYVNPIASYLYEWDKHGAIIVGNVLFIGERLDCDGAIYYCGLSEENFTRLKSCLEKMVSSLEV